MLALGTLLLAAASVPILPAHCRQTSAGNPGPVAWETDGNQRLSISMDARATGEVSLRCRVKVPADAEAVTLELDHALISFQPSAAKGEGSGLEVKAGDCTGSLLRVAGEDWIEASSRRWTTAVTRGTRFVDVTLTVRDQSDRDPVRIDLSGLRLTPGRQATDEVCRPIRETIGTDSGTRKQARRSGEP